MTTEAELARLQSEFDRIAELPESERDDALTALSSTTPVLAAKIRSLLRSDAAYQANDFDREASVLSPALPKVAGYELLDLVGRGGMGRVFRAYQSNDEQRVPRALKLLHSDTARAQLRERFEAECRVLAELDHPGIARYIASGFSDETDAPFVVMEFVEGEPIDRWCNGRRYTLLQRVQLVRQLLAAVQHAHQRLIVHRDIKPGNVLVDQSGRVVLVDFGIAKRLSADVADLTATDNRFLSVLSAAPEQLAGQAASTATDVYAIGLLMYQLFVGHDPFGQPDDGGSQVRYQQRVLDQPAPSMATRLRPDDRPIAEARGHGSVRDLRRALAGDLNRIVLRCLRKAPEERYPDASSLDRDLRAWLEGWPISERESEPVYRLRRFIGRHRIGVSLGALGLLALCATLATALAQRSWALHERDRAEAAVAVLKQAFAAANPLGVAGGDARVSEVLNASRDLLDQRRHTQPDVFAALSVTMAEVELAAGRPRQALQLTRDSLASLAAADDQGLRHRLQQLEARAQLDAGDFTDMQSKLLALPESGIRNQVERETLLGRFAYLQSKMDLSVKYLQRANQLAVGLPAADALTFEANIFLAQALRLNEQPEQAIALLEETRRSLLQHFPAEHPRVLLVQLRTIEIQRGVAPVERLLTEVEALSAAIQQAFGPRSAPFARLLGLRAQLQLQAGQRDASSGSYEQAWRAWSAATDPVHPNSLRALFNLAFVKGRAGHATEEVAALFAQLMSDAKVGAELSPSILNYWRISYVEFLADRNQCAAALQTAATELGAESPEAFNPPSIKLLDKVLTRIGEACNCPRSQAEPACAALPGLMRLTQPALSTTGL